MSRYYKYVYLFVSFISPLLIYLCVDRRKQHKMEYNKIEWDEESSGIQTSYQLLHKRQWPSRCFRGECQSWDLASNFLTSSPQSFPQCHGTSKGLAPTNAHHVVDYSRLIILKIHIESRLFAYCIEIFIFNWRCQ